MLFSPYALYVIPIVVIVALVLIAASVRILREYERAVVFTLGRFQKVKGPGLVLLVPFFQELVRVDLRIQVIEIPSYPGAALPSRYQYACADDPARRAGAA